MGGVGRVYAIGDVHGRFDLFVRMLRAIRADLDQRPTATYMVVFLGDLIDRGPRSAQIIDLAIGLSRACARFRFLKGNHEEMFLESLDGDSQVARFFYHVGGRQTLGSYGLSEEEAEGMSGEDLVAWMRAAVPDTHREFLARGEDLIQWGDYIFVHAGLRPDVPLHLQDVRDLRWIREEFIRFEGGFPGMVVHGHSITEDVDDRANRIGLDIGAYYRGRLVALVAEGGRRNFLAVDDAGWNDSEMEHIPVFR